MKAVGCVAVVLVVAVGGFLALAVLVIGRTEDQSALTERVDFVLSDVELSRDSTSGTKYRFDLAYEVGGRWYGDSDSIDEDEWDPDLGLRGCVDPENPRQFVTTLRSEECGQRSIVAGLVRQAEPTTRPPEPARSERG